MKGGGGGKKNCMAGKVRDWLKFVKNIAQEIRGSSGRRRERENRGEGTSERQPI